MAGSVSDSILVLKTTLTIDIGDIYMADTTSNRTTNENTSRIKKPVVRTTYITNTKHTWTYGTVTVKETSTSRFASSS